MLLKFREWLNKNSAIVTVLAVVVLIAALGFIIMQARGKPYRPQIVPVYYYDLGSGKLFTAMSDQIPPIQSDSGSGPGGMPQGVRAYVYACGDCPTNAAGMTITDLFQQKAFIGWVEMYTPDSKLQMEKMARGEITVDPQNFAGPEMFDAVEQGHLMNSFDPRTGKLRDAWVPANSEPGFMIQQDLQTMCGQDVMPKPCFPPRK